uniref:Glutathione peroxidase n=1 Tax=Rhizophora mucronata TaxID=61149 RepID=A0A2P2K5Y3_RHIMU
MKTKHRVKLPTFIFVCCIELIQLCVIRVGHSTIQSNNDKQHQHLSPKQARKIQ